MKRKQDRPTTAATLTHLAREGALPPRAHLRGLSLIGEIPTAASWHTFLQRMLLFLGVGFLITGIFFFFAWNWDDLHRLAKLGLLQGLIVGSAFVAWQQRLNLVGKVALTAASLLIGAVMAVYGQQYQIQADAWQLFAGWTVLMSGWVVIGRFSPLWTIWQILLNVTLVLFGQQQNLEFDIILGIIFGINLVGLLAWEWAHGRFDGLTTRWTVRLSALAALIAVFIPAERWVIEEFSVSSTRDLIAYLLGTIAYVGLTAAILHRYRNRPRDLPLLALTLIPVLVITTTAFGVFIAQHTGIIVMPLLIGLFVLGIGAIFVRYIYRLTNQEVSDDA